MQTTSVKKTDEALDFNIFKALHVIELDKDLDEIFRSKVDTAYELLRTTAKKKLLTEGTVDYIKEIFERVILKNQKLRKLYIKLATEQPDGKKLPKWYGKRRVLSDIDSNKETTELDRAMLALNKIKNIYSRLNSRAIKDKVQGTKILTRTDCRDIAALARIFENKMNFILKKK